ncbi:9709_t:CDS:2 [Acaulospora colombiana]|uniref:9709_t:CDS:1 n=1 Tax=Acaulospora colombiana TaxID=27376 RepID=A0ACA9KMB8_9GLOM|nr:9709_t:CDS:2 [Acaulospora colombiana]
MTPDSILMDNSTTVEPDYLRLILTSRVYEIVKETPLQHATNLSIKTNNKILLKREDLHEVFSFKIRGAYNKISHLTEEERNRGVIACSADASATPTIKWQNVERLGAKVVLYGSDFDEAKAECARLIEVEKRTNIPPYDDPYVIAGQGTIAMEILRQYKTLDANAMTLSLREKRRVILDEVGLFADGAAVRIVGEETFRVCSEVVDQMINVSNDEICAAIKEVFEDTRSVLEPAGALSVAGINKYIAENKITGGCFVAITSGANMNFERLRFVAERAELGEQREALISVIIPERPGR